MPTYTLFTVFLNCNCHPLPCCAVNRDNYSRKYVEILPQWLNIQRKRFASSKVFLDP